MIAVIFEVTVDDEQGQRYFELAASLRGELETLDGFISVERFRSVTDANKYVSLSFWRDRGAIEDWYGRAGHRDAQGQGRAGVFEDYRIRVADVFRDYDMAAGRPES